jgi:hypothetical protein
VDDGPAGDVVVEGAHFASRLVSGRGQFDALSGTVDLVEQPIQLVVEEIRVEGWTSPELRIAHTRVSQAGDSAGGSRRTAPIAHHWADVQPRCSEDPLAAMPDDRL